MTRAEGGMLRGFVRHLFPRVVLARNLRLTATFCLGGLAFTAFLALLASGTILLFDYRPSPEGAYASILALERDLPGGGFLRRLHRLASHALLALVFAHALRVILAGAYRPPRELNWVIGFGLLLLALLGAYTGTLLPMDQLSLWATRAGMELLAAIPGGGALRRLLVPDEVGGPLSLQRFYAVHVAAVPLGILGLSTLHFFRVRRDGLLPWL